MKYKKVTPHELTLRTVEDINRRRKAESEGRKQATMHCVENRSRIQKRLGYGRY
ncbi:transcriptional regulator [Clostridium botulinum]|nr:transcriptional regulator [Clostridium botulinum]